MAYLVSPCCGDEYTEALSMIRGQTESYICSKCNEHFSDPIEDYEYSEQMKEARDEDRADEARDMGN